MSTLLSSNLTNPKNSGTQSTNYYIELPNLHFHHLSIWVPYLDHLQHFSQTKFTNFYLQFYLAPPLPRHICLQLPNLLSYPFLHPATIAEVSALLSSSPDTSYDLDPIPTSLLKREVGVGSLYFDLTSLL